MELHYIKNNSIDKAKWDSCIADSQNNLIYANSWYLDRMAIEWDGLVSEDYKLVMPLPFRKKFGFSYLYQPFLTAQLGIFGNSISPGIVSEFLKAIPRQFRYWDFSLNYGNLFSENDSRLFKRSNYVLNLKPDYEVLFGNYNENLRRNIKKAEAAGCVIEKTDSPEAVISLALEQMKKHAAKSLKYVDQFRNLFDFLQQKKQAVVYEVKSLSGLTLSAATFFYYNKRAYYILVGNHPESKSVGASHALINGFVRDHAGQDRVLDFEGSDIPTLASFYNSFGATNERYPAIKLNNLPWPVRLLKK